MRCMEECISLSFETGQASRIARKVVGCYPPDADQFVSVEIVGIALQEIVGVAVSVFGSSVNAVRPDTLSAERDQPCRRIIMIGIFRTAKDIYHHLVEGRVGPAGMGGEILEVERHDFVRSPSL